MKKTMFKSWVVILMMLIFSTGFGKTVNVTFRVGMDGLNTAAGVYVGSDWAGWDFAKFQKLSDDNNDSIFEITITLPAGAAYNYRYTIGNTDWNNFEDLSSTTCGAGPKKQDRHIVVPQGDSVLDVYCFNSCIDCKSTPKTYIKLSVDMKGQEISPDGVHVAGSFNGWNAASHALTDEDHDSIYETSIQVVSKKTYEYKFMNGNKWGTEELVFGTCEFRSNRLATVNDVNLTMPLVKFGYCGAAAEPIQDIKIACIGNSITHGYGTSDMFVKCWPFQLRDLLGVGYYAENLGVSGRTMLKTGDQPWWIEPQFDYTFKFQPNIVVIKLGTNDSKAINWNAENYKKDYLALIDTLRSMPSKPEIYMMTPAKAYSTGWGIRDLIIRTEIIPILKEIAFEKGVHLIDVYNSTLKMAGNFPDGIHPNDKGALVIATKVKNNVLYEKPVISQTEKTDSLNPNTSYQWFCNDQPIPNSNSQTIKVTQAGTYKVAIKVSTNDDIYVSAPFQLNFTESNKESTVGLTTNISVATALATTPLQEVSVFPNPAHHTLTIENAEKSEIAIFNTLGEQVVHLKNISNSEFIDISNLKKGNYLVGIYTGKSVTSKKIAIK